MKAIILAAGVGSRLKPLTDNVPKALVKVANKPILKWQIEAYRYSGVKVTDIIVVAGYKFDMIKEFIKENYSGINIVVNKEYKSTNNMYSLYIALNIVDNEDVVISNGDCVYDFELVKRFIDYWQGNSIACDVGRYNNENMKVQLENGKIIDISKKIPQEKSYGLSIDLYKILGNNLNNFKKIIRDILDRDKNLWAEEALRVFVKKYDTYPFDIGNQKWYEVDTIEDLNMANKIFR